MSGFGVGSVLGTAWRVWRRNLLPFAVISIGLYAPALLLRMQLGDGAALLNVYLGSVVINTLIAAALTYGVVLELNGARPSFRDCVLRGLRQLPRALGAAVLSMLLLFVGFLLVLPGVIGMLALYVVVPVAIIERLPAMDVMRRSRDLTYGHKGDVFLILLLVALASAGVTYGVKESVSPASFPYVTTILEALIASFTSVLAAVAYTLLRHEKDGTTVPEIATAFARFTPPR